MNADSIASVSQPSADPAMVARLRALSGLPSSGEHKRGTLKDGLEVVTTKGHHLRLIGLFDAGGMGEVYIGWHQELSREVIVKVPKPEVARLDRCIRFVHREQQFPNDLMHLNLVRVLDQGMVDDRPFVVMEYIAGRNLAALVAERKRLPWREACDLIAQAAEGLEAAHCRGLIHRDLKPENLIVTDAGVVKIIDWGLVRITASAEQHRHALTEAGELLGTVGFAAPEQLVDASKATEQSDLYSLGSTLFFLLTGNPPFSEGSSSSFVGAIMAHVNAVNPPRLRRRRLGIPWRVEMLVRKLMNRDPTSRLSSARKLHRELRIVLMDGMRKRFLYKLYWRTNTDGILNAIRTNAGRAWYAIRHPLQATRSLLRHCGTWIRNSENRRYLLVLCLLAPVAFVLGFFHSRIDEVWRWSSRNTWLIFLIPTVIVFTVLGVLLGRYWRRRKNMEKGEQRKGEK